MSEQVPKLGLKYWKLRARKLTRILTILAKFQPNYVASSSPRSVISVTQPFFFEKSETRQGVCCGVCEEWPWKLVSTDLDQMQVKQIILKDSGG